MIDGAGWGMGFGWIVMVLFVVLIVAGVVALIRGSASSVAGRDAPPQSTPLEILQQRYARGEIERKEYEQKFRDLSRGR